MRTRGLIAAGVAVFAATASTASAAAPLRMVEAGGASYPQRAYVLTLPSRLSLSAAQVHVTENGRPVHNLQLTSADAAQQRQFAVVLAIDTSRSMRGKPVAAAMAAARVFAEHRNPDQQLGVVTFDGAVHVLQPLTTDSKAIDAALAKVPALGTGTKIYDGLQQGLDLITAAKVTNGSIVLLSDGTDLGSVATPAAVLRSMKADHVRGFTVGLDSSTFDPRALSAVAAATGGTFAEAPTPTALTPIFNSLGGRLSSEYLVSYRSIVNPGMQVTVEATVDGVPGDVVNGYRAPALRIVPAPAFTPSPGDRFIQSPLTMLLVALLAAAVFGWGLSIILRRRTGDLLQRVGGFVQISHTEGQTLNNRAKGVADLGAVKDKGWFERLPSLTSLQATLDLADITVTAIQVAIATAIVMVFVGLVLYLIIGLLGCVIALATPFVTRGLVHARLQAKRRKFAEQLSGCLEVLASSLRAGHTLIGALSVVVENAPEPAKSEFQRVIAEERLGVPLEDALQVAVTRMDSRDLDQVALVARLQREAGSNSAEVLDRIVETVRGRVEIRRLVRTLTAQARLSRWILTFLPVFLALGLSLLNHGFMSPMFHHQVGRVLLVITALMVISGSLVIRRLVEIKV